MEMYLSDDCFLMVSLLELSHFYGDQAVVCHQLPSVSFHVLFDLLFVDHKHGVKDVLELSGEEVGIIWLCTSPLLEDEFVSKS